MGIRPNKCLPFRLRSLGLQMFGCRDMTGQANTRLRAGKTAVTRRDQLKQSYQYALYKLIHRFLQTPMEFTDP